MTKTKPPAPASSPLEELQSGDHRRALIALRNVLSEHLVIAEPNVSAQIAARLQAVLDQLATLPEAEGPKSVRDQLKERRERKGSAATEVVQPAARKGRQQRA